MQEKSDGMKMNYGKWIGGFITAIVTGLIVWWLTKPGGYLNQNANPKEYLELANQQGIITAKNVSNDILYLSIGYEISNTSNGKTAPCGYSGVRLLPQEEKRLDCDFVFDTGTYQVVKLGYAIYDAKGEALYINNVEGSRFHTSISVQ